MKFTDDKFFNILCDSFPIWTCCRINVYGWLLLVVALWYLTHEVIKCLVSLCTKSSFMIFQMLLRQVNQMKTAAYRLINIWRILKRKMWNSRRIFLIHLYFSSLWFNFALCTYSRQKKYITSHRLWLLIYRSKKSKCRLSMYV